MPRRKRRYSLIGWREWVSLPELGIERIKAKVDTGAATSSLHAFQIKELKKDGQDWVRFYCNPTGRRRDRCLVEVPLFDKREVMSSNGKSELRPVIRTRVRVLDRTFRMQITLTRRSNMAFPMLLGREALRSRFVIDPSHSYLSNLTGAAPVA